MRLKSLITLSLILLLGVSACAPPPPRTVPRVVDGQVELGPFVSPYAYEWFVEGERSSIKGRHDEAAIALETAVAAPANDLFLVARLIEEYEQSGSSRRADRLLTLLHRSYPDSPQVWLTDGRVKRHRGELDESMQAFLEAKRLEPKWEQPVIELAETLRLQGHVLRAEALLVEYITTTYDVNTEGARHALVDLARTGGDPEILRQAIALGAGANAEREALLAAELAYQLDRPALAARLLESSVGTPENRTLWIRALLESGDQEAARAFLSRAQSTEVGGAARHAELLLEAGERRLALEVLDGSDASPRTRLARGRALASLGDHRTASKEFAAVPLGASAFEEARIGLADSTQAQHRAGAGAEALSLAPHDSVDVRLKLADLYLSDGSLRAALRLFDVKNAADRAVIASLFERSGRYQEAAAYYATVKTAESDEPRVHARAAAERLASRGLVDPAATILERWTTANPDDLYARVRLVELLIEADRSEAAVERGLALFPLVDDPRLRQHLTSLLQPEE